MLEQNGGRSVPLEQVCRVAVPTFHPFLPFAHQKIKPDWTFTFTFSAYILKVVVICSLQNNYTN